MNIKEILELTQTQNIAAIAKEHLTIGEKRLRAVLKEIGATNQPGKKGWVYSGDPAILDQSVYDFAAPSKPKAVNKKYFQEPNETEKNDIIITENKQINKQAKKPTNNQEEKQASNQIKKVTYEIEEWLHDELKIRAIREKRNVSEIVNELIKKGLE
jgi:hypothetical protein